MKWKRFNIVITHILIWMSLLGIVFIQYYSQFSTISNSLIVRSLLFILLFYFNYLVLIPLFLIRKKISIYVLISIVTIGVCLVLMNYYSSNFEPPRMINLPPPNFSQGGPPDFPRDSLGIRKGPPNFPDNFNPLPPPGINGFGISLTRIVFPTLLLLFNFLIGAMVRIYIEWTKNEVARKKVENEKVTSELQFLKTQLNPHFLFNSLNTVYSLSVKKSENTSEAIINLSELMRYMLYEANQNLVPLEKELDYIKNYVQLQILRLSDSEKVSFNVHGDDKNKKIAPLLFISFIENAFKYGTDFKGKTDVKITITITENTIRFFVKNKIGSYRIKTKSSGIGLENIKNRLHLLYPKAHQLSIDESDDYYTIDLALNLDGYEMYNY